MKLLTIAITILSAGLLYAESVEDYYLMRKGCSNQYWKLKMDEYRKSTLIPYTDYERIMLKYTYVFSEEKGKAGEKKIIIHSSNFVIPLGGKKYLTDSDWYTINIFADRVEMTETKNRKCTQMGCEGEPVKLNVPHIIFKLPKTGEKLEWQGSDTIGDNYTAERLESEPTEHLGTFKDIVKVTNQWNTKDSYGNEIKGHKIERYYAKGIGEIKCLIYNPQGELQENISYQIRSVHIK